MTGLQAGSKHPCLAKYKKPWRNTFDISTQVSSTSTWGIGAFNIAAAPSTPCVSAKAGSTAHLTGRAAIAARPVQALDHQNRGSLAQHHSLLRLAVSTRSAAGRWQPTAAPQADAAPRRRPRTGRGGGLHAGANAAIAHSCTRQTYGPGHQVA